MWCTTTRRSCCDLQQRWIGGNGCYLRSNMAEAWVVVVFGLFCNRYPPQPLSPLLSGIPATGGVRQSIYAAVPVSRSWEGSNFFSLAFRTGFGVPRGHPGLSLAAVLCPILVLFFRCSMLGLLSEYICYKVGGNSWRPKATRQQRLFELRCGPLLESGLSQVA